MREQSHRIRHERRHVGGTNGARPHHRQIGHDQLIVVVQQTARRGQHMVRMDDGAAAEAAAGQRDCHLRRVLTDGGHGASVQRVHVADQRNCAFLCFPERSRYS